MEFKLHPVPHMKANSSNNGNNSSEVHEKVMEAYSFICHNYDEHRRDWIILIGFSRGAFTVRCVADLIRHVGLLTKMGLSYLPEIYDLWLNRLGNIPQRQKLQDRCRELFLCRHLRQEIRIKVCAVWDTVSSIGIPWPALFGAQRPADPNFVHSDLYDGIDNAFQALSLHERRYHFRPLVWRHPNGRTLNCNLEQCWFMGYHSDIGGGNKDESLAHFALAWMISKLWRFLKFDLHTLCQVTPSTSSWTVGSGKRT